jgi:arsenate reductase-like glutaredoxin family protein
MKEFPVDMGFYKGIKKRVETARNIDKVLHHQQKERSSQAWLKRAAADAGVDVEEIDTFQDDQYIKQKAVERQRLESTLKAYQAELRALLDRPVMAAGTSSKYITQLSNLGGALGLRAESASADLKKVKKRKAH